MFQSCSCDVPSALCTPCCNACMTLPLETLPPQRSDWGSNLPPDCSVSRGSISHIYGISVFGNRLSRKSDNVVVFPFAFHIAVQQPFKSLWSSLLLYKLKTISSIICSVLQVATDDAASSISFGISLCLTPTL